MVKIALSQTENDDTKRGTVLEISPILQLKANLPIPFIDAPLKVDYVLDVLKPLPESSPVYSMLKGSEEMAFKEYLNRHPNAISWKTIAECLYRCGEDDLLNQLFAFIKSPEGM